MAARTVTIHRIEVLRYEYPELDLDIECGSGTYIRALGRDLGAALGTAGVMSALERTSIGQFNVDQAIALDCISLETLLQNLQPAASAIPDLAVLKLDELQIAELRHGRPIPLPRFDNASPPPASAPEWAAVNDRGDLISLLTEKRPGQLWPLHNFEDRTSAETATGTS